MAVRTSLDDRFAHVLDAVYAAALAPAAWPGALAGLCGLFRCHFGDAFARTTDFRSYRGVAHGLDEADYQDGLLDTWVRRNVWGRVCPVREAGLVVTTREMVDPAVLRRSEMYAAYLAPRDLHEGLRFDLWAGDGWIQDVSLLRSWSAGPFDAAELRLAHLLLPHLGRAAAVSRRLRDAETAADAGFAAADAVPHAVFLTDRNARVLRANRAGERMLGAAGPLSSEGTALAGHTPGSTRRLRAAVAQATGSVQLRGADGATVEVTATPVVPDAPWTGVAAPSVLVVAATPTRPSPPSAAHLLSVFDLTAAEAEVARQLVSGCSVTEIATTTRRSLSTVRTHVARLMAKTGTHRQAALVRALLQAPPEQLPPAFPRFGRSPG